jgi:hypothetical protein
MACNYTFRDYSVSSSGEQKIVPSTPVAFFMLILFIIFSTLSVVTFSKTNLFVQSFCFFISIKLG